MLSIYGYLSGYKFQDFLTASKFCKLGSLPNMTNAQFTKYDYDLGFRKILLNSGFNNQMDFFHFILAIELVSKKLNEEVPDLVDRILLNILWSFCFLYFLVDFLWNLHLSLQSIQDILHITPFTFKELFGIFKCICQFLQDSQWLFHINLQWFWLFNSSPIKFKSSLIKINIVLFLSIIEFLLNFLQFRLCI